MPLSASGRFTLKMSTVPVSVRLKKKWKIYYLHITYILLFPHHCLVSHPLCNTFNAEKSRPKEMPRKILRNLSNIFFARLFAFYISSIFNVRYFFFSFFFFLCDLFQPEVLKTKKTLEWENQWDIQNKRWSYNSKSFLADINKFLSFLYNCKFFSQYLFISCVGFFIYTFQI